MKYVVDTHALIWFWANNPRLGANADRILSDPFSVLVLPAIVLAEICWIVEHRSVGIAFAEILNALDRDPRFVIYPLHREVIEKCNVLQAIGEMHDRQIVATTALIIDQGEKVSLITQDANIIASGVVPILW